MATTSSADTPLRWLGEYGRRYPHAWQVAEEFRSRRGKDLAPWPSWCYLPIAGGYGMITSGLDESKLPFLERVLVARDAGILTALAAWRMTKSVYVFDPTLRAALWDSPVTGNLPGALLMHLPEWCVYLDLTGIEIGGVALEGAWVHLESDANDGSSELRLVLAMLGELWTIPIDLGGTLREGIDSVMSDGLLQQRRVISASEVAETVAGTAQLVEPIVSLVLYLVSEEPEIDGRGQPGNPRAEKVKGGWRTFPSPGPRQWDVGVRVGAALRAAQERLEELDRAAAASGRTVRPHLRRAHWHTFLTGPRSGEQKPVLKWLHSLLVNADDPDELPVVVRPVQ